MYREIITPKMTTFTLELPINFVGKKVEIIAFEINENNKSKSKISFKEKLKNFSFNSGGYKFDRLEATDYES